MRCILALAFLASGATVVAQSSPGTASAVPAGPLQAELETRLVCELDQLASSLDGAAGYIVTGLTTN